MLPYTLSMLIIIILLLAGIRHLLKAHFTSTYKASGELSKLMRRGVMRLIKRLGWGRSFRIMYLFFAVIFTLAILRHFSGDPFENTGKLTIIWLPAVIIRRVRKSLRERRERGYRLPGRRN